MSVQEGCEAFFQVCTPVRRRATQYAVYCIVKDSSEGRREVKEGPRPRTEELSITLFTTSNKVKPVDHTYLSRHFLEKFWQLKVRC